MNAASLIISIIAVIAPIGYSIVVDRRAHKAAGAADQRARDAQQTAVDMSKSLSQMAVSLADIASSQGSRPHTVRDVALVPRWNLERGGSNTYVLRNVGSATARHVAVTGIPDGVIARDVPDGSLTLQPVEGHSMRLFSTSTGSVPPKLVVTCDELGAQPVAVPSD